MMPKKFNFSKFETYFIILKSLLWKLTLYLTTAVLSNYKSDNVLQTQGRIQARGLFVCHDSAACTLQHCVN